MLGIQGLFFRFAAMFFIVFVTVHPLSVKAQPTKGYETIAADCGKEIITYCSKVLPGGDRVVACLIAFEDKVSPRCRLTAYIYSGALSNRMKQLRVMVKICDSDILQYCSKLIAGGGRIFDCLKANKATLLDECREGIRNFEVQLKD